MFYGMYATAYDPAIGRHFLGVAGNVAGIDQRADL